MIFAIFPNATQFIKSVSFSLFLFLKLRCTAKLKLVTCTPLVSDLTSISFTRRPIKIT